MKKHLLLLFLLLKPLVIYTQEPVNILQKINITEEFGNAVIGLDFNGPVSFTSMKLTNPFRIVLDFNDCKKGNSVKNIIKVQSEEVKEISITQLGSNDTPTLRVIILTHSDIEFNIEPTDNGINVRLSGVKLASTNTSESSPNEPINTVEVTPKQQVEVTPEPTSVSTEEKPETKPETKPEPAPVVAESRPEPKPEPAPVVTESRPEPKPEPTPVVTESRPEPKPEPTPVVTESRPEPKPEPTPVVTESRPEPKPEPTPVITESRPEPKPEPTPVVTESRPEPKPEPTPVVTESRPEPKSIPATEAIEERSQDEYNPATREKKEKRKIKFKEAPAMAASHEGSPQPAKQEKKLRFKEVPAIAASNEEVNRTEHISPPPRKKSPSGKNSLTWLGFQVSASGSRIFVKTIDEAEYSIKEKDEKTLVLEIYNTDIPKKNNRRPLDTSFFNSPVTYISPKVEGGAMKVVKIEIKLKQRVPFIAKQESNALYIDFEGVN